VLGEGTAPQEEAKRVEKKKKKKEKIKKISSLQKVFFKLYYIK
jgi:hypothetical protein